jgi:CHAT domain-containing protein
MGQTSMDGVSRLQQMMALQSQAAAAMFEADRLKSAGDLQAASAAFDRRVAVLRSLLQETLVWNEAPPTGVPMDVLPTANQLLDAMLTQADVVEAMGERPRAERLRDEARALAQTHLQGAGAAERERQRAGSLIAQGRFHEALAALAAARDLLVKEGRTEDAALTIANLANALEWLGDYERALAEADRAASLVAEQFANGRPTEASVMQALAAGKFEEAPRLMRLVQVGLEIDQIRMRVARYTGRYAEAARLATEIRARAPADGRAGIDYQLAAIRVREGRHEEALQLVRALEPLFVGLYAPKLPVLQKVKAEALLGLGRLDEAERTIAGAIASILPHGDLDSLWNMYGLHARILERLGRPRDAIRDYRAAAETIGQLRYAPLGWRLDSTYLHDKLPLFREAIALAGREGDATAALELMEMVKSRMLTAVLAAPERKQGGARTSDAATRALAERLEDLSHRLDAVMYAAQQEGWTPERRAERESLLAARADTLERLYAADPRWHQVTRPPPFDVAHTLALLNQRGQACLNLFHEPERITAVLLAGGVARVGVLPIVADAQAALQKYLANLQRPDAVVRQFDPAQVGLSAEALVPEALLAAAVDARTLVVVPHGPLHLLPWAGLTFRGKRLFEYLPVSVMPNASCLWSLDGSAAPAPRIALFGPPDYSGLASVDPLSGAAEEVAGLESLYASGQRLAATPCAGANATESGFWALADQPGVAGAILHAACHARFDAEDPSYSALQLTDGLLDAAEVARARLPYDEVVLSACATGRRALAAQGVELAGDDIVGLPGAFLEAGARSVLVSIPPASDAATLHLMTRYHEARFDGAPPVVALNMAQRALAQERAMPLHAWIGFTLYGA